MAHKKSGTKDRQFFGLIFLFVNVRYFAPRWAIKIAPPQPPIFTTFVILMGSNNR